MFSLADITAFLSLWYGAISLQCVPYSYSLTFNGLAAGGTATLPLAIKANADFVLLELSHRSTIAGAAQTVDTKDAPLVRALITDSGSNERFTDVAVDLENWSANGNSQPRMLKWPRVISGRSALQVVLTNYSAATSYNIDLAFNGIQVRAYSGGQANALPGSVG